MPQPIRDRLGALLGGTPGVAAAWLHGSAVTDRLRPESDVDIAVLPKPGLEITAEQRLELASQLAEATGRPVDLGILSTHNLVYAKEVVVHGEPLFTDGSFHARHFPALALSLYADLQTQRREVLDAYAAG